MHRHPFFAAHWEFVWYCSRFNLTDETETAKAETQKRDSAEVKMEDPIFITLEYYR